LSSGFTVEHPGDIRKRGVPVGATKARSQAKPPVSAELIAAARKVSHLLRSGVKDFPPTDLKADALEACDELDRLCAEQVMGS
jgi:hypothetical protein